MTSVVFIQMFNCLYCKNIKKIVPSNTVVGFDRPYMHYYIASKTLIKRNQKTFFQIHIAKMLSIIAFVASNFFVQMPNVSILILGKGSN